MKTITYELGDLSNGAVDTYSTREEALAALEDAVSEGAMLNMEAIGEEGCPWITEEDAREAAEEFFYVKKVTVEIDEDGDLSCENYEVIAGNIQ